LTKDSAFRAHPLNKNFQQKKKDQPNLLIIVERAKGSFFWVAHPEALSFFAGTNILTISKVGPWGPPGLRPATGDKGRPCLE
jgi:hypothetical protein